MGGVTVTERSMPAFCAVCRGDRAVTVHLPTPLPIVVKTCTFCPHCSDARQLLEWLEKNE